MKKAETYAIENAEIGFRNFEGKEGPYNKEGDRSFAIFLRPDDAAKLKELGWNVKQTKATDDDGNPSEYIQVSVSYNNYPPRIVMITSKAKTVLDEELVGMLDWSDIESCDVVLRPYNWSVNGNTGVKAYVKSLYVKLDEDEFAHKYDDIPEM